MCELNTVVCVCELNTVVRVCEVNTVVGVCEVNIVVCVCEVNTGVGVHVYETYELSGILCRMKICKHARIFGKFQSSQTEHNIY